MSTFQTWLNAALPALFIIGAVWLVARYRQITENVEPSETDEFE